MDLISLILPFNIIQLELCILMDLLNRLAIFFSYPSNLIVTIINLVKFLLHICLMRFFLRLHLLLVLSPFHVHFLFKKLAILVLSRLKLLE